MADVEITCADGRTLQEFIKLIQERNKWLHETAEQACTATLLNVLVTLRTQTVVSSPRKFEVQLFLEATNILPSFMGIKGMKKNEKGSKKFCLRVGKARYQLQENERVRFATKDIKGCKVWRWKDFRGDRVWLIVAHTKAEAVKWGYEKIKKRAKAYKGLAKHAFSQLMMKSGSKTSPQMENANAARKSEELTTVEKMSNGNTFSVQASDMVDYARLAMMDGDNSINVAIKKAANKIASVINTKCKNLLTFSKIETPFPEVRSRK